MIKLTINGKDVTAKSGETVLEVCQREGIYIPTLCYQKDLEPYGGCRLCIVEVVGMPNPMTGCTLPVSEGMVIKTDTELLRRLRKFTLQLILSEHPHSCLICDKKEDCGKFMECIQKEAISFGCKYCVKNSNCELQKLVEELGIKEIPFGFYYRGLEVERYDPFFERDYNLCILCGRCVRACAELRHASVIDFHHRGPQTLIGTAYNLPHLDADCQFCGACVDACPTGAMAERYSKYSGVPERKVLSHCPICSLGCEINLNIKGGEVMNATPNNNYLCVRGRFGIGPLVNHQKRTTSPILRQDKRFVEISWNEALEFCQARLNEYKGRTGIIFSSNLSLEALDGLKQLDTGYLASSANYSGEFTHFDFDKISANSALIILNTDLIEDFSVLLLKIKKKAKPVVIVIDTIETKIAEKADIWLRPFVNHEGELLKSLFGRPGKKTINGVGRREIEKARQLLAGREVYLMYNPSNIGDLVIPKDVKPVPLMATVNASKVVELSPLTNDEVLNNAALDCLYIVGEHPRITRPYKTVIVQDYFLPDFEFDLFLPAATFVETEGSFVNIEGKTMKLPKVVEAAGQAKDDAWIVGEIAKKIGPLSENQPQPPAARMRKPGIKPSKGHPLHLVVRENCYRFRGHRLSQLMTGFRRVHKDDTLWIHPGLAKRLKLQDGANVRVVSENGTLPMAVTISERVPTAVLFAYQNPALGLVYDQYVRLEKS